MIFAKLFIAVAIRFALIKNDNVDTHKPLSGKSIKHFFPGSWSEKMIMSILTSLKMSVKNIFQCEMLVKCLAFQPFPGTWQAAGPSP